MAKTNRSPQATIPLISQGEQMVAAIQNTAKTATPEDHALLADLQAKSRNHGTADTYGMELVTATPGFCALLFLDQDHNRPWDPNWSNEIGHLMRNGKWKPNTDSYALYGDDGKLGNGQHRTAAQAVTGFTFKVPFFLGLKKADIGAIDCGKPRTGVDLAALSGISRAKEKAGILAGVWGCLQAAGELVRQYRSPDDIAIEIQQHDKMLARSLEIGYVSVEHATTPVLPPTLAAKLAGLLLFKGWPERRMIDRLDELQCADFASDKAPLAVARQYIASNRKPDDTLTPQKELAVAVKGFVLAEQGAVTAKKAELTVARQRFPDASYPGVVPAAPTVQAAD